MTRIIGDRLAALAQTAPDRPALVCGGTVWSRARLVAEVERWRAALLARTAPRDGVALAMGNAPALPAAFLACATTGRQALVYDPAWPPAYRAAIDAALAPPLTLEGETPPDAPASPAPQSVSEEAPFYVGFTSGSTGLPKGYRRNHRSWIDSFAVSEEVFGLDAQDVVMAPGGLSASLHLYGIVHALHLGATAVMMRAFHPRRALELVARHGVTALNATPTQLQMLAEAAEERGTVLPGVRRLMVSGAKWQDASRARVARAFPAAALAEFYGASEMSFVTVTVPGETEPEGSVGRAAPGVEIAIRDAAGRDLPVGETGAIWVASRLLFDGYACGESPDTRRDGRFLTIGDHGRLDGAGRLYLAGRERRMLVTSGLNVYPEEVESVLAGLAGVEEVAVFGRPDPLRGAELVAVLRGPALTDPTLRASSPPTDAALRANPSLTDAALRAACHALLPSAKIPRRFLWRQDWPRTSGGKADLRALERWMRDQTA